MNNILRVYYLRDQFLHNLIFFNNIQILNNLNNGE